MSVRGAAPEGAEPASARVAVSIVLRTRRPEARTEIMRLTVGQRGWDAKNHRNHRNRRWLTRSGRGSWAGLPPNMGHRDVSGPVARTPQWRDPDRETTGSDGSHDQQRRLASR